jgi:hypothetical protein
MTRLADDAIRPTRSNACYFPCTVPVISIASARSASGAIPARRQTVTFDPFGNFATEGYLRNFDKEKDLAIVKRAENASFTTGLDEAFAILAKIEHVNALGYGP